MHDDVFRMNLILNGGWTKDTMHILVELVNLALQQKAWNKKYGHLSYADRMSYYVRRAERFKNKRGGSDEQHVQICDRPTPNAEERALKQSVEAFGKGAAGYCSIAKWGGGIQNQGGPKHMLQALLGFSP